MHRQGKTLAAALCVVAVLSCGGLGVPVVMAATITAMEYYIDVDPGVGRATPIPPIDGSYNSTTETGQVAVVTTGLAPGPHWVYVRARDTSGVWGRYPPQLLNVADTTTLVTRAECYIDTDPGQGNGIPLAALDGAFNSKSEAVTASLSTAGLAVGNHTLYLRACNSAGVWGPTRAVPIDVLPPLPGWTISAAQCGFGLTNDAVPTLGTYPMQPLDGAFDSALEQVVRTAAAPWTEGTYKVFVQAQNGQGMWGPWSVAMLQVVPRALNLNVRATQRPGTVLVDIFYDLAGTTSPVFVSVLISTNSGASFNVAASRFTGDGVSTPVSSGTNYHIVWDASSDLGEGYFPNVVVQLSAGGSFGSSRVFAVNLRGLTGGLTLSGQVLDGATGNGVGGASVQLGTNTTISATNGVYSFASVAVGDYTLTASKAGYVTALVPVSVTPGYSAGRVITLWPTNLASAPPKVVSIVSKYPAASYYLDGAAFNVVFKATVDWAGHPPGTVKFITPRKTYTVTTSGSTATQTLAMGSDFGPNGRLRVVATSSDGTQSPAKIAGLVVMPSPFPGLPSSAWGVDDWGSRFSYNASFDTTIFAQGVEDGIIPKSIPVFGDKALKVEFIPAIESVVSSDGTAKLAIRWDDLEAGRLLAAERKNRGLKSALNVLSDLINEGRIDKRHLPRHWFGGLELMLYPELGGGWKYDATAGRWQLNGAFAGLGADLSVSRTWPFVVGVVPVPLYAKVRAALSAEATADLLGLFPLDWSGEVDVNPSLRGSLGVGFSEVVAVEGWVEGGAEVELQWPPPSASQSASLYVRAGATLYYFIGHKDYTGLIWSWPKDGLAPGKYFVLRQDAPWQPLSRAYLNYPSTGVMGRGAVRPKYFSSPGGGANPEILLSPSYPFSDPHCSAAGTNFYLVFLEDNTNRTSLNRTMASLSKYDGTMWSAPVALADDGTADFHPRILTFADGSAVAVWENEAVVHPDTATLDDMIMNLEIAVAWYSPASQSWLPAVRMTTNSFLDRSPKLAGRTTNNVLLTWIANPANDINGSSTAPNQIWSAQWNGSQWSNPQLVATITNAILKYDLAYDGTNGNIVMCLDLVDSSTNANSRELFRIARQGGTWGTPVQLTADQEPDDNPQLAFDPQGNILLTWLKGAELSSVVNFNMTNRQVIRTNEYSSNLADFRLASGSDGKAAILWAEPSENDSDLYAVFFDPLFQVWGAPRQLTRDPQTERGTTAAFYRTNELIAVYNRSLVSSTNLPGTTLSDLAALYYMPGGDLALDTNFIYSVPANPSPGGIATLHVRVFNLGDTVQTNVVVAFYLGAAQPASEIGRVTVTNAISPQCTSDVTFAWLVPSTNSPVTVLAVVDPDQTIPDVSRLNNIARLDMVKPNVGIQSMSWSAVGSNQVAVTVRVVNDGAIANGTFTLSLNQDSATGTNLFSQTMEGLMPGESRDVTFVWNAAGLADNLIIVAVLSGPGMANNFSTGNATGTLAISQVLPPWIEDAQYLTNGTFQMAVYGTIGRTYFLQASTDLTNWITLFSFTCTNSPTIVVDTASKNFNQRFYRIASVATLPRPQLGFASSQPLTSDGLNLLLRGLPGLSYCIEASTNLTVWSPITNFVATDSVTLFRDTAATNFPYRFYRAVVP